MDLETQDRVESFDHIETSKEREKSLGTKQGYKHKTHKQIRDDDKRLCPQGDDAIVVVPGPQHLQDKPSSEFMLFCFTRGGEVYPNNQLFTFILSSCFKFKS